MRPTRNALYAAIPPPARALLGATETAARDLEVDLWLVGGGVRDLAAGRRLHDLDLAFSGSARDFVDAIAALLPDALIERTDRFGTASVTCEGARLDLARLRKERYVVSGALPEVRPTDRITVDLGRRDFTVNAVALGLVGADADEVVDPHGGLVDLRARCLRVLHQRSFADDATRLWRGARTAALFDLDPDAETARLIKEGAHWIETISGERVWGELAATAARGRALGTLDRLDDWGVLAAVEPGFHLHPLARAALRGRRAMPVVRLTAVLLAPLDKDIRERILNRLAARKEARTVVQDTARLLAAAGAGIASDTDALASIEGVHPEARAAARWLAPETQAHLQGALRRWERTRPHLDAGELRALHVPRGVALGAALRGLRRARYLGTLRTPAEARAHVRAVLDGDASWDEATAASTSPRAAPQRVEDA